MSQSKVSVIVPIYNVEKYLRECLDSIVNQTLKEIEIICVNDGSTDRSSEILEEYAQKDSRIKVFNKPNGGYGSAMNVGLNHITGEYIGIVEPDDFIKPEMYQTLYGLALAHQVDIVKSNFINFFDESVVNENGKVIKPTINKWFVKDRKSPTGVFTLKECPSFLSFHPSIWSCIYRTDFIKQHNIKFQEIPGAGWTDNLFQVKTMLLAENIIYTDEAWYYYRKKHLDDASDLKDIAIPFKRTEEIREWLREQGIKDRQIEANLTKRELNYIQLVFRSIQETQLPEVIPYIERYLQKTDLDVLATNPDCTSNHRRMIKEIQKDIVGYYKDYKRKQKPSFWKRLISVKK